MVTIAGIDEVGRGPIAGPVVVGATCFTSTVSYPQFTDSKSLTEKKREQLVFEILEKADKWVLIAVGPQTIDRLNILEATRHAMTRAMSYLQAEENLVDGNMRLETSLSYTSIIKGDATHWQIGAASILAKVWRDRLMKSYDTIFTGYDFKKHKGYPTPVHKKALIKHGPSPIHRFSYRTVSQLGGEIQRALLTSNSDELLIASEKDDYFFTPPPEGFSEYS
ncbi:ribonuclease HII [bacterium]|jgi:ribonuclease HII|nr:ribonuclease HII [bacterium]